MERQLISTILRGPSALREFIRDRLLATQGPLPGIKRDMNIQNLIIHANANKQRALNATRTHHYHGYNNFPTLTSL